MATITSAATLKKRLNPFTGLSELDRARSGIARAELVFTEKAGAWAAPGAGNRRVLTATCSLDTTSAYGYVLTDAFAKFYSSTATIMMSPVAECQISFGSLAAGELLHTYLYAQPDRQDGFGNTQIGNINANDYNTTFLNNYTMLFGLAEPKPSMVIYPYENVDTASQVLFTFGEEVQDRPELNYSLYFRFLQYDVSQSYNYVINSPQLTR